MRHFVFQESPLSLVARGERGNRPMVGRQNAHRMYDLVTPIRGCGDSGRGSPVLTFMATILEALRDGVIHPYGLPEYEGREPLRPLYLADSFYDWVDANEDLHIEKWGKDTGGRSRYEHMEQALCNFRCEERPLVGDLNRVMPTKNGVWKVQCPGLRLYGWAPDDKSLLLVTAAFNDDVHGPDSITDQKVKEVLSFAKAHDLGGSIQYGERSAYFQKTT